MMVCGTTTFLAPPNLIYVQVDGKPVKAVAQLSKQGFCYVFDRVTVQADMADRRQTRSSVHSPRREQLHRLSRFRPSPLRSDRQGVMLEDPVDFTPELHKQAMAVLEKYNYGPRFTPPSSDKPTIEMPVDRRRRQLVRCSIRPRNRDTVRLFGDAPVRLQAFAVVGASR